MGASLGVLGVLVALSLPLAWTLWRRRVLAPGGLDAGGREVELHPRLRIKGIPSGAAWLIAGGGTWYLTALAAILLMAIPAGGGLGGERAATPEEALRRQAVLSCSLLVGLAAAWWACRTLGRRTPASGLARPLPEIAGPSESRARVPAARGWRWRDLALGAGILALVLPAVFAVGQGTALIVSALRGPLEPLGHETLRALGDGERGVWFWAVTGMVVLVGPVYEELLYRGLVQSGLVALSRSRWAGVLATSVVFTLVHAGAAEAHTFPTLFALSVAMGAAFERTGRIGVPIAMHVGFNAANVGMAMGLA